MSNPKISVVLPTYNRPDYIVLSIRSILNQTFKNFEILVLDDASTDNTEDVVLGFNDKRIVYIKNKKNMGYAANIKKGFGMSKGKYIFMISDDDMIMSTTLFAEIEKVMDKTNAGYAQTGLVYYDQDHYKPSVIDHVATKLIFEKPSPDIFYKTSNWHYGFMSGNVFRKDFINIDRDFHETDIWWPFLKAAYNAIKDHGAVYFGKHFIVARTSTTGLIAWLDINKNGSFYMDLLFDIYKEFDKDPMRFQKYLKNRLDVVVGTLPGIKYYTSNENIKGMAYAIVKHRPEYIFEKSFWINVMGALLAPKPILGALRPIRTFIGQRKLAAFLRKIQLEKNLDLALAGTSKKN